MPGAHPAQRNLHIQASQQSTHYFHKGALPKIARRTIFRATKLLALERLFAYQAYLDTFSEGTESL